MTTLLNFFWPLLKLCQFTGAFPFKKDSESFDEFNAIKTKCYILVAIFCNITSLLAFGCFQYYLKTRNIESSFLKSLGKVSSGFDQAIYFTMPISAITHYVLCALIWMKRYEFQLIFEYLNKYFMELRDIIKDKSLIIMTILMCVISLAFQILAIILRICIDEDINKLFPIIEGRHTCACTVIFCQQLEACIERNKEIPYRLDIYELSNSTSGSS